MARYRKIDPAIWNDEKFRAMSDRGRMVFLFILTHPNQTALGAFRAHPAGLAGELGWTEKAFREGFREGLAKALLKADEGACFVWAKNFLRYNRPESPNCVKAWAEAWSLIPECPLKVQLEQTVKGFVEGLSEGFREAFAKAWPKTSAIQEQEQEQEQEQDIIPPQPPKGGGDGAEEPPEDKPAEETKRPQPKARKPETEAEDWPEIPAALDTPEFRDIWQQWLTVAKARPKPKRITPRAAAMQLKILARHPPATAVAMLERSIAGNWQGIFEVTDGVHKRAASGNSATRRPGAILPPSSFDAGNVRDDPRAGRRPDQPGATTTNPPNSS